MGERLNWMISVDDHVVEPPALWQERVPTKYRDQAPQVVRVDGTDYWAFEDVRTPIPGTLVTAGQDRDRVTPLPVNYADMDPAVYDLKARLAAMDADGVLASLCFPFFPRFAGQTFSEAKDRPFAYECLKIYNDWMIDEWCGEAPGRMIPLVIIPLYDPMLAAKEIERCAAKGARAVSFSENPSKLGYPSIHDIDGYWRPVLQAANDTEMPLCIHFGSSSSMPTTSPDAPLLVWAALAPVNLMFALTDWLFSGLLQDYPNLKICLSEGGIGWIPYMLERCDWEARDMRWASKGDFKYDMAAQGSIPELRPEFARKFDVPPSEIFRQHIYGCFIDDSFGSRHIEEVGVDNVMIETDFPHGDTSFPNSIANAHERLAGKSDEVKLKVMQDNAKRVFRFEPAPLPPTDSSGAGRLGQK